MEERFYYLGFSNFNGVGSVKFGQLLDFFGSAKAAWEASVQELREVLGEVLTQKFLLFRKEFSIESYGEKLQKKQVWFITLTDDLYPSQLKEIAKPPFVLYGKGNKELLTSHSGVASSPQNDVPQIIAVVGTRRITSYGKTITEKLTTDLVTAGFIIVSGLALGVDAVAHEATINAGGKTIAVLGCGVDCCYPSTNQRLYEEIIASGGAVVSAFPLGLSPSKGSFPARNAIIAGLSQGVLVTEGAVDSGSLITAEEALKSNRKVFAVPGPITSNLSVGPYSLLKKGAVLVSSVEEIVGELGIKQKGLGVTIQDTRKGDTQEEQMILDLLQNEGLHIDQIIRQTKMESKQIGSLLSLMEIKGMVKSLSNGYFSLV